MKRPTVWLIPLLLAWAGTASAQVVVSAAAFEWTRPVAPGSIAALFGEFPVAEPLIAQELPLPTQLGGVRVLVNGQPAGLYAVFPTQINFMAPLDMEAGRYVTQARVDVEIEGMTGDWAGMWVRDVSPAIFTLDAADATRPGAVLNQDNSVNGPGNPARPGEILQIFGMGQGQKLIAPLPVTPPQTSQTPLVWFRNHSSPAAASALPDGLPGMWQINVPVPTNADLRAGATPITVKVDGVQSNTVTVWIEP
jgi:uncharacterized protein (TIGR03437 family)